MAIHDDEMVYKCRHTISVSYIVVETLGVRRIVCQSGRHPGPRPCKHGGLGCQGELDDQSDRFDHDLNALELFYQLI